MNRASSMAAADQIRTAEDLCSFLRRRGIAAALNAKGGGEKVVLLDHLSTGGFRRGVMASYRFCGDGFSGGRVRRFTPDRGEGDPLYSVDEAFTDLGRGLELLAPNLQDDPC